MFRRKKASNEESAPSDAAPTSNIDSVSRPGPNGYVITELPVYHGLKRKVVVYTSDANGRIIKTYKK